MRKILWSLFCLLCAGRFVCAETLLSESFNSMDHITYDSSSYGYYFGITGYGSINTKDTAMPAEGGFSYTYYNIAAANLGLMAINLETVKQAGVTYTFSGYFG